MKKKMNVFWTIIIFASISFTVNAQDKNIPLNEIPKEITTYLETHFPDNAVVDASFDNHVVYKKYKIFLKDNISLEFSPKYKVTEIKSKSKLPEGVIPERILSYVKTNYPNNVINDWELDDGLQKIELDNSMDLEFSLKGEFLRIND